MRHNHVTREIMPPGNCRACDEYIDGEMKRRNAELAKGLCPHSGEGLSRNGEAGPDALSCPNCDCLMGADPGGYFGWGVDKHGLVGVRVDAYIDFIEVARSLQVELDRMEGRSCQE